MRTANVFGPIKVYIFYDIFVQSSFIGIYISDTNVSSVSPFLARLGAYPPVEDIDFSFFIFFSPDV